MVVYDDGMVRRLNDGRARDGVGAFAKLEYRRADREWVMSQAAAVRRRKTRAHRVAWVSAVLAYFSRR